MTHPRGIRFRSGRIHGTRVVRIRRSGAGRIQYIDLRRYTYAHGDPANFIDPTGEATLLP